MADNTSMNAAAYTSKGTARDSVALPAELFDGTVNMPVMHQAVKAFLANKRQGNASTKTRGFVIGGNQKPWKQKGTGRARQGSTRAPQWVGGGTVFGPSPRSYAQYVPRKVRALARKSAFNARARENAVMVVDSFDYTAPKTSQLLGLLTALGVANRKVLILTDGVKPHVYMSGRNLPRTHVLPYSDVSTYHILWSDVVIVESSAFGTTLDTETTETTETAAEGKGTAAKKTALRKGAKAAKSAKKAVNKTSGRKSAAKKTTAKKKPAAKTAKKVAKKAAKKAAGKKGR